MTNSVTDNAVQALFRMTHEELLWENASLISSFDAQTIKIDIEKYKVFTIALIGTIANPYLFSALTMSATVGEVGMLVANQNYNRERMVTIVSNGIQFGEGKYYKTYASSDKETYNIACIPIAIYGTRR